MLHLVEVSEWETTALQNSFTGNKINWSYAGNFTDCFYFCFLMEFTEGIPN